MDLKLSINSSRHMEMYKSGFKLLMVCGGLGRYRRQHQEQIALNNSHLSSCEISSAGEQRLFHPNHLTCRGGAVAQNSSIQIFLKITI